MTSNAVIRLRRSYKPQTPPDTPLSPFILPMSLPPATKDISEHPKAGSVVAPTDKAAKDADISRKVRDLSWNMLVKISIRSSD